MGTSGTPTTMRFARGRSCRPVIPAGFPLGTTSTGSLRAKVLGASASLPATRACMCFWSADANTSAGAPCSNCVRSSWEPARFKTTLVPGCVFSKRLPSSMNASRSEVAAKTTTSLEASALADNANAAASPTYFRQSERMLHYLLTLSRRMDKKSTGNDLLQRQLGHDLARLARVVSTEARQLTPEGTSL